MYMYFVFIIETLAHISPLDKDHSGIIRDDCHRNIKMRPLQRDLFYTEQGNTVAQ